MLVIVVAIVVSMRMVVLHARVHMPVVVPFREVEQQPHREERC